MSLDKAAIEVRKEYYREYRKNNREKFKQYNQRYWEKKAKTVTKEEEGCS